MVIGILQPGYLPWLGFFEQIYQSNVFIIYDDVQYDKHGWRNRNKIKTSNGVQWLTVPVQIKFREHPLIRDVKIDNTKKWKKKHLFSIRQNYSKSPFFEDYINIFELAYSREWKYLIEINMFFIIELSKRLGMQNKKLVYSSALDIEGDRQERIINICKKFGADTFYEGPAGRSYIDEKHFNKNGINVEYQDYKHPVYNQMYGDFIPYLSVIDLLFNHGKESLSILAYKRDTKER